MIEGVIEKDMTVETDQIYHKTVDADANALFQQKKISDRLALAPIHFYIKKGHNDMDIQAVGEVVYMSIYHLLEPMDFDAGISSGVKKMRAATILGDILRPQQCTKNLLKYFHKKSKYGHFVAIPDSVAQEQFSRAAIDKGWVDKMLPHSSGVKEEKNVKEHH